MIPVGVPGYPEAPNVDGQLPHLIPATPELFDLLDLQLVEGRRFTAADDKGAPVVIVNTTMATTIWPNSSAVGKCIRIGFDSSFDPFSAAGPPGPPTTTPCREIVGVVRDVRQRSVVPSGIENRLMQYFVPFSQVPAPEGGAPAGARAWGLLVRTSGSPEGLIAPIRNLVVGGRTDLPFLHVRPYADLLARQMRPWRLGAVLLSLFGALALGVAAVGLYAAFAHLVGQRRREMAIRIAIGARPAGVLTMILGEAAVMAAAGIVCGVLVILVSAPWLASMLFDTKPADPMVLGSAALLMIGVAAAATFMPARSASRTDPITLLRVE